MKYIYIYLLSSLVLSINAQKQDYFWMTGRGGGIQSPTNDDFAAIVLDFNQLNTPQIVIRQELDMNFYVSNGIICDSSGQLQLYSNGEKIYSKNHYLMSNGANLAVGDGWGLRLSQGAIALPYPEHPNQYIMFYIEEDPNETFGRSLRYHLVDMNENNGLGKVIERKKILVSDTLDWGKITATKHANGRDWWVLIHRNFSDKYYSALLSPDGISIDTFSTGLPVIDGLGQVTFSPDGTKYARVEDRPLSDSRSITLYDFDRCAGVLTNPQKDTNLVSPGVVFGAGASISPDSRYLYIFHTEIAVQYDLTAPDIFGSRKTIALFDGFQSGPFFGAYFLFSQLGPDGRIYVASWANSFHWHVLNFPNREGEASQFLQHHLSFNVYAGYSIPNLPNFRLGPLDGSPCDTLGLDNHPLARYRWEQEDSLQILNITFTDLSSYEPDTWSWDFGDGTHSNERYPVHSYDSTGIYEVCLMVSNAFSSDTFCQTLYLGVSGTEEPGREGRGYGVVPNPANDMLWIKPTNGVWNQSCFFNLYDSYGRLVLTQALESNAPESSVQISRIPAGVYYHSLIGNGFSTNPVKLIILH